MHSSISGIDNENLSELLAKLTFHWVFVRSDRHSYFELSHHEDLFTPLNSILQRVIGARSDELLQGLQRILANAQSGLADSGMKLAQLHETVIEHPEFEKLFKSEEGYNVSDLSRLSGMSNLEIEEAFHSFLGTRLFEVKKVTGWPDKLVQLLSYAPGDAGAFLEPDERAAWPTRVWPIFQKPFLYVANELYCFDHIAFCDRFYRQITRALRNLDPTCATELKDIQAANVETIAATLLSKLLFGAKIYRNVFYEHNGELCETDLVLTYKDTLIVAEVRSGSITPESPKKMSPHTLIRFEICW